MQGLFFYWTAWGAWVIVTFFMIKGKTRTGMAFLLLAVIMCSNQYVTFHHTVTCVSLIPLLFYSYQKLGKLKGSQLFYTVCACHVVMLAYIGFSLYALYAPAILWVDQKWMAAALVFLLVHVLVKSFPLRCMTAVIGAVHGNLLFAWIMNGFSLSVKAGSFAFFDMLAACLAVTALWWGYLEFVHVLNRYFKRVTEQRGHYTK